MSRENELLPLPFSGRLLINWEDKSKTTTLYTADQMREYALANLQADKPADQFRDATKMVPAEGSLPVVAYELPCGEDGDSFLDWAHHYPEPPAVRVELTDHAQATSELAKRDEVIERYSMCIRENHAEIERLRAKLAVYEATHPKPLP